MNISDPAAASDTLRHKSGWPHGICRKSPLAADNRNLVRMMREANAKPKNLRDSESPLAETVAFLLRPDTYPHPFGHVASIETHMSFVFLVGDLAYKLKKPIKLSYLDFSTVEKRAAMCRAEFTLNRRLAPSVYRDVIPLCRTSTGLKLGDGGPAVDWLVMMRRLDERLMLDEAIANGHVSSDRLELLEHTLCQFFRRAKPVFFSPGKYLARWRRQIQANRTALLQPKLRMPVALVSKVHRLQLRFLDDSANLLLERVQNGKILDGHGDLRPEHIWLGEPLSIIDCLEFSDDLRAVDPFDELAYLSIECQRLGEHNIGPQVTRTLMRTMGDCPSPELLIFYRCYRATVRATLSAVHLLEPNPRTPEKWRPLALQYLAIALREAEAVERLLNKRGDHPAALRSEDSESHARKRGR